MKRVGRAGLCLLALIIAGCSFQAQATIPTLALLPTATLAPLPTAVPSATLLLLTEAPSETAAPAPTNAPSATPPLLVVTLPPLPAPTVATNSSDTSFPVLIGNINVTSAPGIILRRDPAESADVIAVLPGGTVVRAQARTSDSQWIEVVSDQGIAGWVAARDVYALVDLAVLPLFGAPTVIAAVPTAIPALSTIPAAATNSPTLIALPTSIALGDVRAMENRLGQTPILENLTSERVRAIFAAGQRSGSAANVFTTIGDSNTTNGDFLQPIGMGADVYCTWGSYDYLHTAVAYFSTPDSFTHHSFAAGRGFSSAAVLDPFWATDAVCLPDESPLLCEYRTVKPSAAIIMLGNIDVIDLTSAEYADNMRAIVEMSIQQGVIPVLTTFVVLPERTQYERSLEFNMALLDIAVEENVPLINLWAAAQTLPDHGIGPDHTHLKAQIGSFCAFDGGQTQYGGTLRNLLTLQALDTLRLNVLSIYP